ncbi:MAG TPA: DUF2127 domain-containing protein [Candidatus Acidoferrales bacterium]|nr:DUF2127 domain-containing protein [Candidatus Acidoferrales bacterium]
MARPTGVTILAVLSFLGAGLCLLGAAGMFLLGTSGLATMGAQGRSMGPLAAMGAFAGIACLVLAVLYVVNGVGLWKLQGWARMLTIILLVIGIVFGVLGIVRSLAPLMVGMLLFHVILIAINAWIVMYLFKPRVKQAFGERSA